MDFVRDYAGHLVLFAAAVALGLVASPLPELIDLPLGVLAFVPVALIVCTRRPTLVRGMMLAGLAAGAGLVAMGQGWHLVLLPAAIALFALGSDQLEHRGPDPMAVVALGLVTASFVPAAQYYQSVLSLQGPHDVDIFAIFGSSLAVALVILSTLALLSGRFRERNLDSLSSASGSLWFPAPTSGIIPLVVAFSVLNAATAYFGGGTTAASAHQSIAEASITTNAFWPVVRFSVVFIAFLIFTAIFNPSRAMKEGWGRALEVSGDDPDEADALLHRARRRAMWVTILYLVALTGVYEWAGELAAALGTIAVSFFTAVAYDIRSEMNYREEQGFYVTIFEPRAVWQVPHVRAALESAGIPVFVRGWGLRSMLRILGTWSDLEVMIPGKDLDESERIVRALGLTPAYDHREDEIESDDGESQHDEEEEQQ